MSQPPTEQHNRDQVEFYAARVEDAGVEWERRAVVQAQPITVIHCRMRRTEVADAAVDVVSESTCAQGRRQTHMTELETDALRAEAMSPQRGDWALSRAPRIESGRSASAIADEPLFFGTFPDSEKHDTPATRPVTGTNAERHPAGETETHGFPYQKGVDYNGDGVVDTGDLARATQNPVADLISVPLQGNLAFESGPKSRPLWVTNFQPVLPVNLSDDWLLINRIIQPTIYAPPFASGQGDDFGLGDLQYTAFFAPKSNRKFIWGVGPVFQFPTATDSRLGSGKWNAGPSAVALFMDGPWVVGGVAQQVWSICGDADRREVSAMLIQPFVNYNLEDGWYLTTSPIITANWMAPSGNRWTVPVGGGIGKVIRVGKLPVNLTCQGFCHVEAPEAAGTWSMRVTAALLFPRS